MKTLCLSVIFVLFLCLNLIGQSNFKWDIKIDSLKNNRAELYSITKQYIAETWKSAQNVIQNDDKENGIILVKGNISESMKYMMNIHEFVFNYNVKFMIKDNKCRLVVDNVICNSHRVGVINWPVVIVNEVYSDDMKRAMVNEKNYLTLMQMLKTDIQTILVDSYPKYLKNSMSVNNW